MIVATHTRREFIVGAVRSAFESGLDPGQLDVIVTKGYESEPQDAELRRLGARVVFDPSPGMGQQLWQAVPLTRAPLVAFLDDDDLFEPTRLAHVCRVFGDHPGVGFYRNRVTVMDRDGQPVPRTLYSAMELEVLLDRTGALGPLTVSDPISFRLLDRCYPWFNTSTMVVRREVLTGPFGHLLETADCAPDTRLYLIALLSGLALYIDDERLIRYRASSPTWPELANRAWADLRSEEQTAELSEAYAPAPWPEQFRRSVRNLRRRAFWSEFVARIDDGRPRLEVASALLAYFRLLADRPSEVGSDPSRFFYLLCTAAYMAIPSAGRGILRNASTRPSISPTRRRAHRSEPPSSG